MYDPNRWFAGFTFVAQQGEKPDTRRKRINQTDMPLSFLPGDPRGLADESDQRHVRFAPTSKGRQFPTNAWEGLTLNLGNLQALGALSGLTILQQVDQPQPEPNLDYLQDFWV